MAVYNIAWKPSALRELKHLDRQIIARIIADIEALASNPFPYGGQKLQGTDFIYRIRIGNYRVIYEVCTDSHNIEIARVRHRKDAYR